MSPCSLWSSSCLSAMRSVFLGLSATIALAACQETDDPVTAPLNVAEGADTGQLNTALTDAARPRDNNGRPGTDSTPSGNNRGPRTPREPNTPTTPTEPVPTDPTEPTEPGGGTNTEPTSSKAITDEEAARFLVQASFGPTESTISELTEMGYSEWILDQLQKQSTPMLPRLQARAERGELTNVVTPRLLFYSDIIDGDDQLRQRMTFALSQIVVASTASPNIGGIWEAIGNYVDILQRNSLGNYRDLLEEITYSPAMAYYLTYFRNQKANPETGSVPDENYAREIMQLFTIGLVELNQDGTPKPGNIETYTNEDIQGLAKVFTGLSHHDTFGGSRAPDQNFAPLVVHDNYHSPEEKTFLGLTIPANTSGDKSIEMALDHLFNHPNVAPFISRQLIQRFVTSNPTRAYVKRVADTFDRGSYTLPSGDQVGEGRRGDLAATVAAILMDTEARSTAAADDINFGKVREPVLRFTHWARAFGINGGFATEEGLLSQSHRMNWLNQAAFSAPSVFNFFRPGFVAPGTTTSDRELKAPELQLVNDISVVGYINFMSRYVRDQSSFRADAPADRFSPDYTKELSLSETPAALLDRLDLLLFSGQMHEETRARIQQILDEVEIRPDHANEDRETRVKLAVVLAVTAPEFSIQR